MLKKPFFINFYSLGFFFAIFIGVFWFHYKNSKRFRQSVRIAIIIAIVILLPPNAEAKSNWFPGVDAFTPVNRNSGF